jgi:hypothetical protein
MPLYEKRTYCITVGRMADVVRLYTNEGWPVMEAAGFGKHLVGYFISDTGPLHQLIHVWRFDDDSARRAFWQRVSAHQEFMAFWAQVRPVVQAQEVQLLVSAPWGPQP